MKSLHLALELHPPLRSVALDGARPATIAQYSRSSCGKLPEAGLGLTGAEKERRRAPCMISVSLSMACSQAARSSALVIRFSAVSIAPSSYIVMTGATRLWLILTSSFGVAPARSEICVGGSSCGSRFWAEQDRLRERQSHWLSISIRREGSLDGLTDLMPRSSRARSVATSRIVMIRWAVSQSKSHDQT